MNSKRDLMEYGFFCDTGPIRGFCDVRDQHRAASLNFFTTFPVNEYNFYVPDTVVKELNGFKNRLRRQARKMKLDKDTFSYLRLVQQCMDRFISQMTLFSSDDGYEIELEKVIVCIQPIIGFQDINQRNDVDIVSNAIIWSTVSDYDRRILITLDRNHLYRYQKKLVHQAEKELRKRVPLSICYLPFFQSKGF